MTVSNKWLLNRRIFVAGHRGMVGSAIVRRLLAEEHLDLITRTHSELDLADQQSVMRFFREHSPECVVLAAAKVGGIMANYSQPADFIYENLAIQTNVIRAAKDFGVKRLLFLGSSCIYPRDCPQPIREEYIMTGPLEATNRPYAMAKLAGIEACWAFNRQYQTHYVAVMPTNLYGPNDNYDLANSHVVPALIRKMHEAKVSGAERVHVWGTGLVRREFLHSDDLAHACVFLLELPDSIFNAIANSEFDAPLLNVGYGRDLTVRELAEMIREIVGFTGQLEFDTSKPDGTPQKCLEISRMTELGWRPSIDLRSGLESVYRAFCDRASEQDRGDI